MPQDQDNGRQQIFEKGVQTAQVVSLAIGGAIVVYIAVACLIATTNPPFQGLAQLPEPVCLILRCALWGLAVVGILPLSMFLRSLMWRPDYVSANIKTMDEFRMLFIRHSIILSVLAESPAIWGFVLFLLADVRHLLS